MTGRGETTTVPLLRVPRQLVAIVHVGAAPPHIVLHKFNNKEMVLPGSISRSAFPPTIWKDSQSK